MPDNLTITIGADTTKLRADLAQAQEQLKQFSRELRQAAAAARESGQTTQVQAAAARYELAAASVRKLSQEIRALRGVSVPSFREIGLEVGHFAHAAGIGLEGIRALRFGLAGLAAAELIRGIKSVVDTLTELGRQAKIVNASTQALQAWDAAMKHAGGTSDDAKESFQSASDLLTEARKRALEAGQTIRGEGVNVIRGGQPAGGADPSNMANQVSNLVQVFHGGIKAATDFKNVLQSVLGMDPTSYGYSASETERFVKDASQRTLAFDKLGEHAKANQASLEVFHKTLELMRQPMQELVSSGDFTAMGKTLGVHFATDKEIAAANRLADTIDRLTQSWNAMAAAVLTPNFGLISDQFVRMGQDINELISSIQGLLSLIQSVKAAAASAVAAVTSATVDADVASGSSQGELGLGGMASGGYVRGAGSGTSNSIFARLSNGEYVVNAASVRRLGTGFLHGLNRFAAGGMVMPQPIRFAAGGLVGSGSARAPVNLHIGGQSFALHGSDGVVDALVSQAHWQQVRSAGVKPSWFAGRPGAR